MVDANFVLELEQQGIEYKNAFKIVSLMENEGITKEEAIKRVTTEMKEQEAKENTLMDEAKKQNLTGQLYPDQTGISEENGKLKKSTKKAGT